MVKTPHNLHKVKANKSTINIYSVFKFWNLGSFFNKGRDLLALKFLLPLKSKNSKDLLLSANDWFSTIWIFGSVELSYDFNLPHTF